MRSCLRVRMFGSVVRKRGFCTPAAEAGDAFPLQGQSVLVTGGSSGIGLAVSQVLARNGARILVTSRHAHLADHVATTLDTCTGQHHVGIEMDLRQMKSIRRAVEQANRAVPEGLDVLVNNAGLAGDGLLLRCGVQLLDDVLAVNLRGPLFLSKEMLRSMMRRKKGHIISIGSIVGRTGGVGQVAYSASKAGLVGMTKSLSLEYSPRGIRANLIQPAWVRTPMTAHVEQGDMMSPDVVADAVLRLIVDPSEPSGEVIDVTE